MKNVMYTFMTFRSPYTFHQNMKTKNSELRLASTHLPLKVPIAQSRGDSTSGAVILLATGLLRCCLVGLRAGRERLAFRCESRDQNVPHLPPSNPPPKVPIAQSRGDSTSGACIPLATGLPGCWLVGLRAGCERLAFRRESSDQMYPTHPPYPLSS